VKEVQGSFALTSAFSFLKGKEGVSVNSREKKKGLGMQKNRLLGRGRIILTYGKEKNLIEQEEEGSGKDIRVGSFWP